MYLHSSRSLGGQQGRKFSGPMAYRPELAQNKKLGGTSSLDERGLHQASASNTPTLTERQAMKKELGFDSGESESESDLDRSLSGIEESPVKLGGSHSQPTAKSTHSQDAEGPRRSTAAAKDSNEKEDQTVILELERLRQELTAEQNLSIQLRETITNLEAEGKAQIAQMQQSKDLMKMQLAALKTQNAKILEGKEKEIQALKHTISDLAEESNVAFPSGHHSSQYEPEPEAKYKELFLRMKEERDALSMQLVALQASLTAPAAVKEEEGEGDVHINPSTSTASSAGTAVSPTADFAELKSKHESVLAVNRELEEKVFRYEAAVSDLTQKVEDAAAENRDLKNTLGSVMASENQKGREKQVEADRQVHKLEAQIVQLQRESSEKEERIQTLLSETETIRRQLTNTQNEREVERALAEKTDAKVSELEEQVAATTAELRAKAAELESAKKASSSGTAEAEKLRALIADKEAKHKKAMHDQHTQLLEEFNKLKENFKLKLKSEKSKSRKKEKLMKTVTDRSKSAQQAVAVGRRDVAAQLQDMGGELAGMRETLSKAVAAQSTKLKEALDLYHDEAVERKKLYNQLQEMKGNIRVYCRVRPLLREEAGDQAVELNEALAEVVVLGSVAGQTKKFEFDHVFGPGSTQQAVFQDTQPLVTSVVDGYNVCIFAYGQTGAGKTYTMDGPDSDPGVNSRALSELFHVANQRASEYEITISMSMLEIYNESVRDLLAQTPPKEQKGLSIKQGASGLMELPGLVETVIASYDDVMRLLRKGSRNRAVGMTNMNEHSSRSHSLLRVNVTNTNRHTGVVHKGRLTLVDLAGSERVSKSEAAGERLREAQAINKSLSALGDVVQALATKQSFVPYRNSKLTYLLQDSLGGDSKTLLFCNVSPAQSNVSETQCSLLFAARARAVELGQAKQNTEAPEVALLRRELKQLRSQMSSAANSRPPSRPSSRTAK